MVDDVPFKTKVRIIDHTCETGSSRSGGNCTDQQSDSTSLATGVAAAELSGITDQQLDVTDGGARAGSSNFVTPNEGSPQSALNLFTSICLESNNFLYVDLI